MINKQTIEDFNFYVTMTDTFMSGWGQAENKINKLVIGCKTRQEAKTVAQNARRRHDMKDINTVSIKPIYQKHTHLVSFKTKEDMPNWFVMGYFK